MAVALPTGDQRGEAGRRVAAQPAPFASSRPQWADLNPGPQAANKIQGNAAQLLLHKLYPALSESAQLSQSPLQAMPWPLAPVPGGLHAVIRSSFGVSLAWVLGSLPHSRKVAHGPPSPAALDQAFPTSASPVRNRGTVCAPYPVMSPAVPSVLKASISLPIWSQSPASFWTHPHLPTIPVPPASSTRISGHGRAER